MRRLLVFLFTAAALCAARPGPLTDPVYADLNGVPRHPLDPGRKTASVLFFYGHDCPVSNGYAPEINRICSGYSNFNFYVVQVGADLTATAARAHARQYHLRAPVLLDPRHELVKVAGATVTPEAVVLGRGGEILYRGRIDNQYAALGKQRRAGATQHDLRDALDAIGAGKPVGVKETTAVGCLIE